MTLLVVVTNGNESDLYIDSGIIYGSGGDGVENSGVTVPLTFSLYAVVIVKDSGDDKDKDSDQNNTVTGI